MSRRITHYTLSMLVMLVISNACFATGEPALLKSELQKLDKIWVGQQVGLNITLFTTSSFTGTPRFEVPKDSDMVIMVDDTHPVLGSETIDGTSYVSKQYTISLFPLRVGTLTIPSFQVEFGYQGDGLQKKETSLPTTAQQFTVLDVPGCDPELPLITTMDMKIDDQWKPEPGKATVGDAFRRTITMTADGLPGMAFPPLKINKIEGLAIYSEQPEVDTETERGAFTGKRLEVYSYICQKSGAYTLPEMKIQWWNPADEKLEVIKLRSVTFEVAPNPVLESSTSETAEAEVERGGRISFLWRWAAVPVLVAIGTALIIFFLRKNNPSAPNHEKTEKELFKQFKLAAESNDAAKTMQALIRWLDVSGQTGGSVSISEFLQMASDPKLELQLSGLETSLYSRQEKSWSGKTLYERVAKARKINQHHEHIHLTRCYTLKPLNP